MEKIKIDMTARGGQIKVMNAVNNGPMGVDVRNPNRNNIELFREAEIPFARAFPRRGRVTDELRASIIARTL